MNIKEALARFDVMMSDTPPLGMQMALSRKDLQEISRLANIGLSIILNCYLHAHVDYPAEYEAGLLPADEDFILIRVYDDMASDQVFVEQFKQFLENHLPTPNKVRVEIMLQGGTSHERGTNC